MVVTDDPSPQPAAQHHQRRRGGRLVAGLVLWTLVSTGEGLTTTTTRVRMQRLETQEWRGVEGVSTKRPDLVPVGLRDWSEWYKANEWLTNGHAMTIVTAKARVGPETEYERFAVPTFDGGSLAVDVVANSHLKRGGKLCVLLSGLGGGSQDSYVKCMAKAAVDKGYGVAVVNMRGCGESEVTSPRFFSAYRGSVDDVRQAVRFLRDRYHPNYVAAIGWSNSGSIIANAAAGDYYPFFNDDDCNGDSPVVDCACALAAPLNMPASSKWLQDHWFHRNVYDRSIGTGLATKFRAAKSLFVDADTGLSKPVPRWEGVGGQFRADVDLASTAKTIRDIDHALTAPCFGFPDVDAYYAFSSSDQRLAQSKIPLLVLNAHDDPIARWGPAHPYPDLDDDGNFLALHDPHLDRLKHAAEFRSDNLVFAVTKHGGHLGWADRSPRDSPRWVQAVALDFLDKAIHSLSSSSQP